MDHERVSLAGRVVDASRLATVILVCAVIALLAAAGPARAQDSTLPAQVIVTVVPPNGHTPRPTGNIIVSLNGRPLLTLPLLPALDPLTALTPLANATLAALGQRVTIGYSGDNNYEASDGVVLSVPTSKALLTIVPRPRDSAPPAIEILSPSDGVRYEVGEPVTAVYSCKDPSDRSPVTKCAGPVPSGGAIDTSTAGTFTFTVTSTDDLGNETPKSVSYSVGAPAPPPTSGAASPSGPGNAAPPPPPPPPPPPAAAPSSVAAPTAAVALATATTSPTSPASESKASPKTRSRSAAPAPSSSGGSTSESPKATPQDDVSPVSQELKPYDPRSEPQKTFGILAAGLTLLSLAVGGGGIARGGGVSRSSSSGDRPHGAAGGQAPQAAPKERPRLRGLSSYQGVEVRMLAGGYGVVGPGDRSPTWKWPVTAPIDVFTAGLPVIVARRSPLLGRVLADSAYVRAILGSASLLLPAAGLCLGIAAVQDTGGEALPPVLGLALAITVLGVMDAAAGLVAVLTFLVGTLLLGGITTADDVRLMLGLGALWAIVPVLAGTTRPLRRTPTSGLTGLWERGADFVVVALIGAWAVQRIVIALPGLAGVELPIADHANDIAEIVLAALVVRLALETIASHMYPMRLDIAVAGEFPTPSKATLIGSAVGRSAIYCFLAYILIGYCWQLWASTGLFLLTQLIWVYPEKFPNSPALYRALPKGVTQLVVFLFAYTIAWLLMSETLLDIESESFFPNVFVGYGLLGLLLPMPLLFGRAGEARKIGWGKRLVGLGILVLGVVQVLHPILK